MCEDELISLGAAILLGPMITNKRDLERTPEIAIALGYAHFLHEEVIERHEKMTSNPRLGLIEYYKQEAEKLGGGRSNLK